MKNVKIVRIFERNIILFPPASLNINNNMEQDDKIKINYFNYRNKKIPYICMKAYKQEYIQHKILLKEDLGISNYSKIIFDKRFLPYTKNLSDAGFIEENDSVANVCFNNLSLEITKESAGILILDITGLASRISSFDSRKYTLNIQGLHFLLRNKYLEVLIIMTKANDFNIPILSGKLFRDLYTPFFESIKKLNKELYIITEDGILYDIAKNKKRELSYNFLLEHLKQIITKPYIRNYGHFEVSKNTHVWIFQDFYTLLRHYEDVFFSFFERFIKNAISKLKIDAVISFAQPKDPLEKIAGRLQQSLNIKFFSIDNASSIDDVIQELKDQQIKAPLLLTDVIYSGNTARDIVIKLKEKEIEAKQIVALSSDKNKWNKDTENIEGIAVIVIAQFSLPWFNIKKEKCPLCDYGIPKIKRTQNIEARKKVNNRSITPFDFYEFVRHSEALDEKVSVTHNRNYYHFYFDTSKILEEYGNYIARVVWEKLGCIIGEERRNQIESIICPVDMNASAILLSTWISDISPQNIPVIAIEREDIENWNNLKRLEPYKNYITFEKKANNALIVDDGINKTRTKNILSKICTNIGIDQIGVFVFLNRVPIEQSNYLEKVWWVYHWPSPPFEKDNFPYNGDII
jgi:adenine/guanine phosphoribosyltransferase-like PRPP-binding protein